MSNFGYPGQRTETDGSDQFNALQFAMKMFTGKMFTSMPVQVKAISGGGVAAIGRVDVMPLVNMIDSEGNSTPHQTIFNLPYFRYQGGASAVIIDPVANDIGLALVASRDVSAVKRTLKQSNPGSFRRFDLSDSFYIGCFLTGSAPTDYVQALTSGGFNVTDRFGNSITTNNSGVTINGVLFPRGGNNNFSTHKHSGVTPGGGESAGPVPGT